MNQADERGRTPLCIACEIGHTEVVAALLAGNADVNQAKGANTPLMIACIYGLRRPRVCMEINYAQFLSSLTHAPSYAAPALNAPTPVIARPRMSA